MCRSRDRDGTFTVPRSWTQGEYGWLRHRRASLSGGANDVALGKRGSTEAANSIGIGTGDHRAVARLSRGGCAQSGIVRGVVAGASDIVGDSSRARVLRSLSGPWDRDALCREHPEVNFYPGRGESSEPRPKPCAANVW